MMSTDDRPMGPATTKPRSPKELILEKPLRDSSLRLVLTSSIMQCWVKYATANTVRAPVAYPVRLKV